jgi:hypothetical protein
MLQLALKVVQMSQIPISISGQLLTADDLNLEEHQKNGEIHNRCNF